ncbi:MAG TPA: ABC transporter substrate-binding protein [Candidatus Limnocylindrales bacterium]
MPSPRRTLIVLLAAALVGGACGSDPSVTEVPSGGAPTTSPAETPAATEITFAPSAWPANGSACDDPAYAGRLGRIEAPDTLTVVFSLCAPDGAFRTRLAHPSLAVVDATAIARLAADGDAGRTVAGTGPYRIEGWREGNVELALAAPGTDTGLLDTVVIGWQPDAAARAASVLGATVDGIDSPDAAVAETMATQPEVAVLPRPDLATAYLGFGSGTAFATVRVRRAIAMGLDPNALAAAFGPGSIAATATAPCSVAGGCGGHPWWTFDAPAAAAALAAAKFDLKTTYPLLVPDAPTPGLPDPAAAAAAVQAQLKANLGLLVEPEVVPAATFAADLAARSIDGLYLSGVTSSLADASGFLEPLFGRSVTTTAAGRATGVANALETLARTTGTAARAAVLATANDAVRATVAISPLVHPGSVAVYRSDVTGVAVSPLGLDALGSFVPGDRHQLVYLGASEPGGAWCGNQTTLDAFRLCGLVTDGLYGFAPGTLDPEPRLAVRCTPNTDATIWTCRLRPGVTFGDGMRLDAGDVLASFVAQWDGSSPLRTAGPPGAFASWDALFGGPAGG